MLAREMLSCLRIPVSTKRRQRTSQSSLRSLLLHSTFSLTMLSVPPTVLMLLPRESPNSFHQPFLDSSLPRNWNTLMELYPTEKNQWPPLLVDPRSLPRSLSWRHFLTSVTKSSFGG